MHVNCQGNHPCPLWNAHYVRSKYGTKRWHQKMPDSQKMSDPHPTIFILDFSNSSMLRKKLQKYTNKHSPKWCVKNGKLIFSQMDPNGGFGDESHGRKLKKSPTKTNPSRATWWWHHRLIWVDLGCIIFIHHFNPPRSTPTIGQHQVSFKQGTWMHYFGQITQKIL